MAQLSLVKVSRRFVDLADEGAYMGPKVSPPGHILSLDQLFGYISEQIGRLESKIDAMVTRRELEALQEDLNRAHGKIRDIDGKVRDLELANAKEEGRFTLTEKVIGIVVTVIVAAAMAYLGLH